MKRLLLNVILPALAFSAITVSVVFPKPLDLKNAVLHTTGPTYLADFINPEVVDARPIIQNYADVVPGLRQALYDSEACFLDLPQASPEKLEQCAPVVTALISQVAQYQENPTVLRAFEVAGDQRLLQQLQIAAVEVCRTVWSNGRDITHGLDTPACRVAQVQLAPSAENH